ncbi:MAG: isoleucine--tRNA ligase [Thermodesulfovibrionia bacterium]
MKKDYKDTLNLPKTSFPMKANLARKEVEILELWETNNIYQKMQDKNKSRTYILHDGPPYANGHIHLGHALNKILKDIIVKYKSMKGFYAPFVPGWDCHGLPIEHEVDKKLGSKKRDTSIIDKRKLCREYALKFLDIQREEFRRLGVFGDWAKPYITMSYQYEASIIREFNRFVEKGNVYKGKKPVHWCPSCITALAEAEVEHADKESPSIYVKFKVKNPSRFTVHGSRFTVYFVIWTTTPWTLPANMALTLHPDFMYRLVKTPVGELIIAQDLIKNCMENIGYKEGDYTITDMAWSGKELKGIECSHPWIDRDVATILGEHVTLDQGTGVVHTAPGHGEDDYEIGLKCGLEVYAPVDERGCFTDDVEDFAKLNVFKANKGIIDRLKADNALLGDADTITHSYPHCWRCKKPVIFRATEQWFISMEKNDLRSKALAQIRKVRWIPAWGMERIYGMVKNRPDWCISRQRTWGVPITLFNCVKCNEFITDKSVIDNIVTEVEKHGADVWFEKPEQELIPNGYTCKKCGSKEFTKETDILDVWFDSGVSHAAVLEVDKKLARPADLYLEGSDQHRGWFQSSLLTSVGTRDKAPYNAVLTHGFVVDGHGKKMSKSLGNVVSPQEITNKHGAEILRLWSSAADYREDIKISNEILDRLVDAYRKIRNTCRFLSGNLYDFDVSGIRVSGSGILNSSRDIEIDRLALSMLQGLTEKVTKAYENFEFHEVFHAIYNFCVINMSSFYFDVLKDRLYTFKADSQERRASQFVLYKILTSLTKMMAPILSFTAEEIWNFIPGKKEESVFLAGFPEVEAEFRDKELEKKWESLLAIRDEVNKALEIKRKERFIGTSLEAKVSLYGNKANYKILEDYKTFISTLFIVSSAEVFYAPADLSADRQACLTGRQARLGEKNIKIPDESYKSSVIDGLAIMIEKADGEKCSRCWNWSITTGKHEEYPELCERCRGVLRD